MTFGNILKTALGHSTARFGPRASDKNAREGDYFMHRAYHKGKEKSKSDKKHAILSALTLLAFLFFLNVLQNCIKEQNQNRGTVTMFAPTAPTGQQSKEPNPGENSRASENYFRKKRSLLGLSIEKRDERASATQVKYHTRPDIQRQMKFIRNYNNVGNWTGELSQVSEKDLADHKLKTMNFPLYWKNKRFAAPTATRLVGSPLQTVHSSRPTQREEKTPNLGKVYNVSTTVPPAVRPPTPVHVTTRYSQPIPEPSSSLRTVEKLRRDVRKNFTQSVGATTAVPPVASTPRNRRSDITRPSDYDDRDAFVDDVRQDVRYPSTPAVGLDLNTFQTFPVYNYYGHRYGGQRPAENDTTDSTAQGSAVTPEITDVDRTPAEVRIATEPPTFYPAKTGSPFYGKHPVREKISYKHPNHHAYYHPKIHRPSEYRVRYSPYRKTGIHEPSPGHFHDYHGPLVVARYPVEEEPGFDVGKFLWTMFTSVAKPLANLVPSFAKENTDEAQCYDLVVCEAQRVSKLMGPTAEALAATVGTLLSWAATEDTRQIVADAINSGRDNTCQQQIKDCEDRSGGKSAMTVIAQVMEMKLR